MFRSFLLSFICLLATVQASEPLDGRYLLVATPGIRNYLEYGGHGILVFDIDDGHRFIKRIPSSGLDGDGKPMNVKGIAASPALGRLFVTTLKTMMAFDLQTDQLLWEKSYEGGCDRMAISPDGKTLYVPSLEQDHWNIVDGESGQVIHSISPKSGAHNTLYSQDGKWVYCAGLKSPLLTVADPGSHSIHHTVGPFSNSIRPFTVNAAATRCYVTVNELLGFEVGDLVERKKLWRIEVQGFSRGPIKRHGCPSHGIGLTPDESEVWVCDAANQRLHVFDNRQEPPKPMLDIRLRDEPGWITFGRDGRFAYPSTGEVIDIASHQIVTSLFDENRADVQSEKMVEVEFRSGKPIAASDQFGIGRKPK